MQEKLKNKNRSVPTAEILLLLGAITLLISLPDNKSNQYFCPVNFDKPQYTLSVPEKFATWVEPTDTPTPIPTLTATPTFIPPTSTRLPSTPTKTRTPTPKPTVEKPTPVPTVDPRHNGLGPETPLILRKNQSLNIAAQKEIWLEISTPGTKTNATMIITGGKGDQLQTRIYGPSRYGELFTAIKNGEKWPSHAGAFSKATNDENLWRWSGGTGSDPVPWIAYFKNNGTSTTSISLQFDGQLGPCATNPRIWHKDSAEIEWSCNLDWDAGNPEHKTTYPYN